MSISLVLLPLAVAAVTTMHSRRQERDERGRMICHVGTRMRDVGLLADALGDTGAVVTRSDANAITAEWQGVAAVFTRDQAGIWAAQLSGEVDDARAVAIVSAVDAAYGRRVQAAVLEKLRERAPHNGLSIESERRQDDDSVVMVLTVQQGAERG